MSLLRRGNRIATVTPQILIDDGYGGTQPGPGEPIEGVRVWLLPLRSDNHYEYGWLTTDTWNCFADWLPEKIFRIDIDGDRYSPEGPVQRGDGVNLHVYKVVLRHYG